jgi:hypothetical protein
MTEGETQPLRPLPMPNELTTPFWEAARNHRLAIQRCGHCERWNHPPAVLCPSCGSERLEFEPVSGRGTVYSWTIILDAPAPGFADMLPLVVGLMELEEQPGLLLTTNIRGVDPNALSVGLALAVSFEDLTADITIPIFVPASS